MPTSKPPRTDEEAFAQSMRNAYETKEGDAEFWTWLKGQLTVADYEACTKQPRPFVQQLHATAWRAYVEDRVQDATENWTFEREVVLTKKALEDIGGQYSAQATTDADWNF